MRFELEELDIYKRQVLLLAQENAQLNIRLSSVTATLQAFSAEVEKRDTPEAPVTSDVLPE